MINLLVTVMTAAITLPVIGGLAYRKSRQSQIAEALKINTTNGIVEERFISAGGIQQWIQIRGEDRSNPVLLILHGGPGWPNATFTPTLRSWEKHFTVVQWDQRGAGKTLGRNGKSGTGEMTFDRRISDAIEVTEFLRQYLHKDKVVLLAESFGTLVGVPLVKRRPDLFSALVVTDLYVDMARNEAFKYQLTLERLRAGGNTKGVAALEKIGSDLSQWNLNAWNTNMGWAFKTNIPTPNLDRTLLFPLVLFSPIYSVRDIYSVISGFYFSTKELFEESKEYDARKFGTRFDIPFIIIQGESDVITLTPLAKEYFDEVEAPEKHIGFIQEAGHFAMFTHPEQFLAELLIHLHPFAVIG